MTKWFPCIRGNNKRQFLLSSSLICMWIHLYPVGRPTWSIVRMKYTTNFIIKPYKRKFPIKIHYWIHYVDDFNVICWLSSDDERFCLFLFGKFNFLYWTIMFCVLKSIFFFYILKSTRTFSTCSKDINHTSAIIQQMTRTNFEQRHLQGHRTTSRLQLCYILCLYKMV